jgi:putative addiction module component (TIGR02574 family)
MADIQSLDHTPAICDFMSMPTTLERVTKDAMDLSLHEKLALAELLLESADVGADPEAEAAWDTEIRARIRAIDEGRVKGVPYAEVMRKAEQRLVP